MLLDIVILPPAKVRKLVARLAKNFNRVTPSPCVVDNIRLIPHISLYHLNIKKNTLNSLNKEVKQVVAAEHSFTINSGKLHVGKVAVDIPVRGSGIRKLNKKVLKNCARYHTGIMPYTFKYKQTPAIKRALNNYGTVGTVVNYTPHITLLVNLKGLKNTKISKMKTTFIFKASTIAVCQINRWYQVTKVLKKFNI